MGRPKQYDRTDLLDRAVEVFRLQGSVLEKADEFWAGRDDRLRSPLLPDFDESLTRVFRR